MDELGSLAGMFKRSAFPLLLLWGGVRFGLDVSLKHFCLSLYLELQSRFQRAARVMHAESQSELGSVQPTSASDDIHLRGVCAVSVQDYTKVGQTDPPSRLVTNLFGTKPLPVGEQLPAATKTVCHWGSRPPCEEAESGLEQDDAWHH
eukprot:506135-Amphidinium_carterae.1